ncbi:MAG: alginate export family protein [Candidatus Omnitrophica bacterium]|nr:alginate export family protein [Candidatus Omnitrophota bacterium]
MKILCVVALVFAFTTVAYAETQSIKISGDITQRAFARGHYQLDTKGGTDDGFGISTRSDDWDTFLQSTAEIQIDADLTDNVSGVIRLVNQRVWGENLQVTTNVTAESGLGKNSADDFSVVADLAYIELKEFLYSPLTLRIGRQDLWFGRGMIVGNSLQNPTDSLYAPEYTAINSFDAIRATFDWDPWTLDVVVAKIQEHQLRVADDVTLWGGNLGYVFDSYNAEAEAYYWYQQDRLPQDAYTVSVAAPTGISTNPYYGNDVHTFGLRGSMDPIEDWTVALEGAYQGGQYRDPVFFKERERSAWMLNAFVECRTFQDDFAWKPVASLEYVFYSGNAVDKDGRYSGWDPMYRGRFITAIREFQNLYYPTRQDVQDGAVASANGATNQHQIQGKIVVEPMDDVTCSAAYTYFWLDKVAGGTVGTAGGIHTSKNIGSEVDLQVTWDYTEDVSFGLLSAWFVPGDHFESPNDHVATDVVGTVKLSF